MPACRVEIEPPPQAAVPHAEVRPAPLQNESESERDPLKQVVANSPTMRVFMTQLREVALNDRVRVLLQGETGTGKQFLSRVIHQISSRAEAPYIEVDCPSVPGELFESELFGHERGAFTGAVRHKCGLIELAGGGTVVFDEIGDLPLGLQAKLLRVIEEGTTRRVGGTTTIPVNVRFIAATNRNLRDAVSRGEFREDLYFRLSVATLRIPPLRDRQEDIVPLAEQLLLHSALALEKPVPVLGASAREFLKQYGFPGNVRELRNMIEWALLFCPGIALEALHFPAEPALLPVATSSPSEDAMGIHLSFRIGEQSLADLQNRIIEEVLKRAAGNKSLAAQYLGITRWTLDRRRNAVTNGHAN